MMRNGSRMIKVKKGDLIKQITANKVAHIKEYKKAVKAFKLEAIEQLKELIEDVENGEMEINLDLTTPIDNSENYDEILEMFQWEVEDLVELEQNEFREYVQDKTGFALMAKSSNTVYFANHDM